MVWLLLGTAALLLLLDAANFTPIAKVRATALAVGRPVSSLLAVMSRPVSSSWNGVVHFDDIQEENYSLRQRIANLEGASLAGVAADTELRALLEASEISYVGDMERVVAQVVTDRVASSVRIIEIDKGSNHGLREKMPVVTGSGLVGQLAAVSGDRSTVLLLTSDDLAVGIRSAEGLALTAGRSSAGEVRQQPAEDTNTNWLAGPTAEIEPGSTQLPTSANPGLIGPASAAGGSTQGQTTVSIRLSPDLQRRYENSGLTNGTLFVTSGLNGSDYPSGIPVGRFQIRKTETTIVSVADLERISYLTVLLSEPGS